MTHAVFLVRHAEVLNPEHIVYADISGFGLSELGWRQAADTAEHLSRHTIARVVASPLERAQQTAGAIALRHGLEVETDGELTEWRMAQRWKGVVWEELDEQFPGELEGYLRHPWDLPWNEEPLADLAKRMATAVERLCAGVDGGTVIVSHQDPIQACRLAMTGRTLRSLNEDKPSHGEVFQLRPGTPWTESTRWAPSEQFAFPPKS